MIARDSAIRVYEDAGDDFRIDLPEFFNFAFDVVDAWAEKDRNKLALIWVNQKGEEKKYSFWDLKTLSNEAANILLKFGINKGDRVFVMLPRIPEWWILTLALMKLGAVFAPSPTMLTTKDIIYRINEGDFKMVITDMENAPKFEGLQDSCPSLVQKMVVDGEREDWISYPFELAYPAPVARTLVHFRSLRRTKPTDPLLIFFTSGTTGEAKMVLHEQSYALGHIITARFWHDLKENDLHFTVSDTGWAKAAWGKYFGQWICGSAIFVYDIRGRFKATELLPLIERYGITTFCAPPTIYRMLIIADLRKFDFSELRHCCSAGEPLNPEVIRIWREGTGLDIYEGYGQTETVCCIATFPGMKCKYGSMGKPSPGWQIELHDEEGKPVPDGEAGRIAISLNPRPVGLFREYLYNPEANAESFVNGFYYTGDKAYKDDDGYLWFVGRDDDVIKSSGYRIGPFEVESALLEHPAVQEAAVIGTPDMIRGMVVKAFIVLHEKCTPSEKLIKEIQNYVKQTTAPYKYPRSIEFVSDLPKTISGKIKRAELREREMARAAGQNGDDDGSGSRKAPKGPVEE
ncbi:acyl-CoA synthetase [Methanocalculus chunghsingensis]|uniref:Acyl-CoA synthetase n=1 Tax=Methanocalculus chunghsingensis TaxID=156457 RepID=A0A8J8B5R2_9EURY|nr:AMP-binding protein [Methanocalculus chunghsingensis]MBR1369373.1 acyl-CoA synthetase [Methanocalculus chunghsingensis]